jgi:hypothetical protein
MVFEGRPMKDAVADLNETYSPARHAAPTQSTRTSSESQRAGECA